MNRMQVLFCRPNEEIGLACLLSPPGSFRDKSSSPFQPDAQEHSWCPQLVPAKLVSNVTQSAKVFLRKLISFFLI